MDYPKWSDHLALLFFIAIIIKFVVLEVLLILNKYFKNISLHLPSNCKKMARFCAKAQIGCSELWKCDGECQNI